MKRNFTMSKTILLIAIFACMGVGINKAHAANVPSTLTITPQTLSGFKVIEGTNEPSKPFTFTVEGKFLDKIASVAPANPIYEYSTDNGASWSDTFEIVDSDDDRKIPETTIQVRLKSGLLWDSSDYGEFNEKVQISGYELQEGEGFENQYEKIEYLEESIKLEGKIDAVPLMVVEPTELSFKYMEGESSPVKEFTVEGIRHISNIIYNSGEKTDYLFSTDNGETWNPGFEVIGSGSTYTTPKTRILVRLKSGLDMGTYNENITIDGFWGDGHEVTIKLQLSGEVTEKGNYIGISSTDKLRVFTTDAKLIIENAAADSTIEVYNTLGQKIAEKTAVEGRNQIALTEKGLLIVRVGKYTTKVMMK